jgi:hypothetical protein
MEIEVKFSEKSEVFIYLIETVLSSDNGFEKTYRRTVVMLLVKFLINPYEIKTFLLRAQILKNKWIIMDYKIVNIFLVSFIGALCNADITIFRQFMICCPIFCAPIIGFFR